MRNGETLPQQTQSLSIITYKCVNYLWTTFFCDLVNFEWLHFVSIFASFFINRKYSLPFSQGFLYFPQENICQVIWRERVSLRSNLFSNIEGNLRKDKLHYSSPGHTSHLWGDAEQGAEMIPNAAYRVLTRVFRRLAGLSAANTHTTACLPRGASRAGVWASLGWVDQDITQGTCPASLPCWWERRFCTFWMELLHVCIYLEVVKFNNHVLFLNYKNHVIFINFNNHSLLLNSTNHVIFFNFNNHVLFLNLKNHVIFLNLNNSSVLIIMSYLLILIIMSHF